jgi:hypothetical protein
LKILTRSRRKSCGRNIPFRIPVAQKVKAGGQALKRTKASFAIPLPFSSCEKGDIVKQPTDQEQRKEDKKEEQLRNPSRVKEPEPDEPEGEIEATYNSQDPRER